METGVVVGAVALAFAAWCFMFLLPRDDIWPRTWLVAGALTAYALVAMSLTDGIADAVGPVAPEELFFGAAVGVAWLVATHVGHALLCRLFPSFVDQVKHLYELGDDRPSRIVGPIVAMAVAEELLFRGVIQHQAGLLAGVAAYTAVQLVERKWALALAAALCGLVWGGLVWWRDGLVAAVLAHVIWTSTLMFLWPLSGCGRRSFHTPADELTARS